MYDKTNKKSVFFICTSWSWMPPFEVLVHSRHAFMIGHFHFTKPTNNRVAPLYCKIVQNLWNTCSFFAQRSASADSLVLLLLLLAAAIICFGRMTHWRTVVFICVNIIDYVAPTLVDRCVCPGLIFQFKVRFFFLSFYKFEVVAEFPSLIW